MPLPTTDGVDVLLEGLEAMSLDELRAEWVKRQKRPAPACRSKDLLRGLLAYAMQERAYGGLKPETRRRLREINPRAPGSGKQGAPRKARLMPGTILVRDWHGTSHKVVVLESGFTYGGQRYADLSTIARAITGARWSGPRFFSLNKPGQAR